MATFHRQIYTIKEYLRWWGRGQLVLQPKFQRRAAWEQKARSYLIDTVVRGLPMPKIYVRRIVRRRKTLSAYEVVDGQQRLRSIVDFYEGRLRLSRRDHEELGNRTFAELPDPVQRAFLEYEISTELMEKASDPEVWAMFERLNSYTLTLNRQEKLNAKYFGYFKQTAYQLAAEDTALEAWRRMKVFGNRQIARMKEVELTADILVALVWGISDIVDIAKAFDELDDSFPRKDSARSSFKRTLEYVSGELGETVRETRFRRKAWFYSLMVAAADAISGIPNGAGRAVLRRTTEVSKRMRDLDEALIPVEPPEGLAELKGALSRATSHPSERRVRHVHFYRMLTLSGRAWRNEWERLSAE